MTAERREEQLVRLQKVLAERGVASRRAAEQLISAGRVKVNGALVTALGAKVNPQQDRIELDGRLVGSPERLRYILLYKPGGYISSAADERGRRTVLELLSGVTERLYPVGRLDYHTSGLLLLTNDGELTHRLLHPSRQVEKTYLVALDMPPNADQLARLRQGVQLEDGLTAPAKVRLKRAKPGDTLLEITIHEGRNRQVRRMLEAVDCPVKHLRRTQLAFLGLSGLQAGEWRELSAAEVAQLKQLTQDSLEDKPGAAEQEGEN